MQMIAYVYTYIVHMNKTIIKHLQLLPRDSEVSFPAPKPWSKMNISASFSNP